MSSYRPSYGRRSSPDPPPPPPSRDRATRKRTRTRSLSSSRSRSRERHSKHRRSSSRRSPSRRSPPRRLSPRRSSPRRSSPRRSSPRRSSPRRSSPRRRSRSRDRSGSRDPPMRRYRDHRASYGTSYRGGRDDRSYTPEGPSSYGLSTRGGPPRGRSRSWDRGRDTGRYRSRSWSRPRVWRGRPFDDRNRDDRDRDGGRERDRPGDREKERYGDNKAPADVKPAGQRDSTLPPPPLSGAGTPSLIPHSSTDIPPPPPAEDTSSIPPPPRSPSRAHSRTPSPARSEGYLSEPEALALEAAQAKQRAADQQTVESLKMMYKKRGHFDALKKDLFTQFQDSEVKAGFLELLEKTVDGELDRDPSLMVRDRAKAAVMLERMADKKDVYRTVEDLMEKLLAEKAPELEGIMRAFVGGDAKGGDMSNGATPAREEEQKDGEKGAAQGAETHANDEKLADGLKKADGEQQTTTEGPNAVEPMEVVEEQKPADEQKLADEQKPVDDMEAVEEPKPVEALTPKDEPNGIAAAADEDNKAASTPKTTDPSAPTGPEVTTTEDIVMTANGTEPTSTAGAAGPPTLAEPDVTTNGTEDTVMANTE